MSYIGHGLEGVWTFDILESFLHFPFYVATSTSAIAFSTFAQLTNFYIGFNIHTLDIVIIAPFVFSSTGNKGRHALRTYVIVCAGSPPAWKLPTRKIP